MVTSTDTSPLALMLRFLDEIALPYRFTTIDSPTFLPGLSIDKGSLLIDKERLKFPGDILHEAGHIAVAPAAERATLNGNVAAEKRKGADGEEIAAILWSYAALKKIGLPPNVVFHPHGYRGGSDWFINLFASGKYMGLPLLEWMGLTASEKKAETLGIPPFPHMIKWMRD